MSFRKKKPSKEQKPQKIEIYLVGPISEMPCFPNECEKCPDYRPGHLASFQCGKLMRSGKKLGAKLMGMILCL